MSCNRHRRDDRKRGRGTNLSLQTLQRTRQWPVLAAIVIGTAFVFRLRVIWFDDVFFTMSSWRWAVEHGAIPWTDTFSFTAYGHRWIYPLGAGAIFYVLWQLGGGTLLSLAGPFGCAATAAVLIRRNCIASCFLTLAALPLFAARCSVRADIFSTILTAGFLKILWTHHETGRARIWLLPVLTIARVNLHLGFILGLAHSAR